jgi:DNA-binding NtrC family response regulator
LGLSVDASQLRREDHNLVLVVGDAADGRSCVRHALERDGIVVVEAAYGSDGLARLQELQPDCIVLDHGSEGERLEILAAVRDGDVLSCAVVEIDGDSTRDRVNGVIHLQKNALCEESAAAAVRVAINLARLARENDLLVSRLCESKTT